MVYLSHALNIAILLFVCRAMFSNTKDVEAAFGPPSTARAILACVYFAIMSASMVALACAAWGAPQVTYHIAWVLFPLQIGYKTAGPASSLLSTGLPFTCAFIFSICITSSIRRSRNAHVPSWPSLVSPSQYRTVEE